MTAVSTKRIYLCFRCYSFHSTCIRVIRIHVGKCMKPFLVTPPKQSSKFQAQSVNKESSSITQPFAQPEVVSSATSAKLVETAPLESKSTCEDDCRKISNELQSCTEEENYSNVLDIFLSTNISDSRFGSEKDKRTLTPLLPSKPRQEDTSDNLLNYGADQINQIKIHHSEPRLSSCTELVQNANEVVVSEHADINPGANAISADPVGKDTGQFSNLCNVEPILHLPLQDQVLFNTKSPLSVIHNPSTTKNSTTGTSSSTIISKVDEHPNVPQIDHQDGINLRSSLSSSPEVTKDQFVSMLGLELKQTNMGLNGLTRNVCQQKTKTCPKENWLKHLNTNTDSGNAMFEVLDADDPSKKRQGVFATTNLAYCDFITEWKGNLLQKKFAASWTGKRKKNKRKTSGQRNNETWQQLYAVPKNEAGQTHNLNICALDVGRRRIFFTARRNIKPGEELCYREDDLIQKLRILRRKKRNTFI